MQLRVLCVVALLALVPLALARTQHHHSSQVIDSSNVDSAFSSDAILRAQFNDFKKLHGKVYESAEVEQHRFELFKLNQARAEQLNQKNPEAKFGVTKFSDLHPLEFKKLYLTFNPMVGDNSVARENAMKNVLKTEVEALPNDFDWRKPGSSRPVAVTAVKDQGQCGSCWAFSATEEVESSWILKGHSPVKLAPQQTVDCDQVDQGCNGGDTVTAYQYIQQAGGIEPEADYPYVSGNTGVAGNCAFNKSEIVAKISGFKYATPGCTDECTHQNEALLETNLYTTGPVSICVDAEPWQTYISGILGPSSGCTQAYDTLDHCVQLVGYGIDTASNQKFWSIRNSWNTDWGEDGYIRILYGQNTCGVADEATIVTI